MSGALSITLKARKRFREGGFSIMIIIHKFDDFLFNLSPSTRGKENDIDLLKQELIDYYTFGPFRSKVRKGFGF